MRFRLRSILCGVTIVGLTAGVIAAASADRLEIVAGGGARSEGIATECKLDKPFACGEDRAGNLYVVEYSGRLVEIDRRGQLRRVAGGNGDGGSGDGGPAADSRLNAPHHILVLSSGDVLVADTMNNRVRLINSRSGKIVPYAGTGVAGYAGDGGPASDAQFGAIYCLALDALHGQLYLDDLDNRRIRRIDMRTKVVSTVAGNGRRGSPQDGAMAISAPLEDPRAIAVDSKGRLYILERGGNALRMVDSDGRIHTVAGTGKTGPPTDGPARSATLSGPKHIVVDRGDNVLIADTDNHVIRRYSPRTGRIITLAGTGNAGAGTLGVDPKRVDLSQPHGVYVDGRGEIYICDSWNDRVVRIVAE